MGSPIEKHMRHTKASLEMDSLQEIVAYTNTKQVNQDYLGHKCPRADVTLHQDSCRQFVLHKVLAKENKAMPPIVAHSLYSK